MYESNIEIERAHRAGSGSEGPRSIAIKLLLFKDKEDILANAKRLKDTGIFINQSFSDKVNDKRAELWKDVKKLRKEKSLI